MRVLVLHSDVARDAPPDEQDTLIQAAGIEAALNALGHHATRAPFVPDPAAFRKLVDESGAELVFNLVESVWGRGAYAPLGAQLAGNAGIRFTGSPAATLASTSDKLLSKRLMQGAKLPTAPWREAPHWDGMAEGERWIVKSADEDASLGLDDAAVVTSSAAAAERAAWCRQRYGGRWFAETFIDGREFNVALLERDGEPQVLPIGEMTFENWDDSRPRIVGYAAKWHEDAHDYRHTPRVFGWDAQEPKLRKELEKVARACWQLFGCRGYARVDMRVDRDGRVFVLEVNANPCLSPEAGFAAAAEEAGLSYNALIDHVVRAAL